MPRQVQLLGVDAAVQGQRAVNGDEDRRRLRTGVLMELAGRPCSLRKRRVSEVEENVLQGGWACPCQTRSVRSGHRGFGRSMRIGGQHSLRLDERSTGRGHGSTLLLKGGVGLPS